MSTLEATVSMLESMPEDARTLVYQYTRTLFTSYKPANPFVPVSMDQVLSDLEESRNQQKDGLCVDMKDALDEMGKRHGFV